MTDEQAQDSKTKAKDDETKNQKWLGVTEYTTDVATTIVEK